MEEITITRPPLASLACINPECELYGQSDQDNLIVRKIYGKYDAIRYLRCRRCREEFSERKNTALWNSKIPEKKRCLSWNTWPKAIASKAPLD
jgi:hypothetical protein